MTAVLAAGADNEDLARHAVTELQPAGARLPAEQSTDSTMTAAAPPLWLVPPVVTLAVMLWGIQGASYSRDEAATMSAVLRPFDGLLHMLGKVDAVHGLYYVIMWPIVRLIGPGEVATRLPSALAMAVAAAVIFALGKRLVSTRAGLAAGLVFAILPQISIYGQTARPYAVAVALAAIASYLLVLALEAAAAGDRGHMFGWLFGYGACLAVLGYVHVFGLLLAAAHAVPVARGWLRRTDGRTGKSLALGWLAVVMAAFAAAFPVIAAAMHQDLSAVSWAKSGALTEFADLTGLIGPHLLAGAACVAVIGAIAVSARTGRTRLAANWPGDLIALCVPWLILPTVILVVASSLFSPVYVFRYVIFCAPAAALLLGAGLAALGWRAGTAALAIMAALALPSLLQVRTAGGHGDDIRGADRIVAMHRRPGDALIYMSINEPIEMAYPFGIGPIANVVLGESPNGSGTLGGTWAPLPVVQRRIRTARRMWLVQLASGQDPEPAGQPPAILHNYGFRKVRTWHTTGVWLTLYVRRHDR